MISSWLAENLESLGVFSQVVEHKDLRQQNDANLERIFLV